MRKLDLQLYSNRPFLGLRPAGHGQIGSIALPLQDGDGGIRIRAEDHATAGAAGGGAGAGCIGPAGSPRDVDRGVLGLEIAGAQPDGAAGTPATSTAAAAGSALSPMPTESAWPAGAAAAILRVDRPWSIDFCGLGKSGLAGLPGRALRAVSTLCIDLGAGPDDEAAGRQQVEAAATAAARAATAATTSLAARTAIVTGPPLAARIMSHARFVRAAAAAATSSAATGTAASPATAGGQEGAGAGVRPTSTKIARAARATRLTIAALAPLMPCPPVSTAKKTAAAAAAGSAFPPTAVSDGVPVFRVGTRIPATRFIDTTLPHCGESVIGVVQWSAGRIRTASSRQDARIARSSNGPRLAGRTALSKSVRVADLAAGPPRAAWLSLAPYAAPI